MAFLGDEFAQLPANLANHMRITLVGLGAGAAISLPLAAWLLRSPRARAGALGVAGVIQTVPSLALLALMAPVVAGLSLVTQRVGVSLSSLGFWPAVIALTLYSMLPMMRNAVTGLLGVAPEVIEAARAVGMTERQTLLRVRLPLAFPTIIAGVRTATVWVVGMATLATPVGQRSLGNYIFQGLQTRNWTAVLFGCVAAALLAVGLDALLAALERSVRERRRGGALAAAGVIAVVFAVGLAAPAFVAGRQRGAADQTAAQRAGADAPSEHPGGRSVIRIGAKTFTEQYILARAMSRALRGAGYDTRLVESLGSTVVFDALVNGDIDVYVDYTGTIWANYMRRSDAAPKWETRALVAGWLARERGVRALGALGFENRYALAVPRKRAQRERLSTIADLARGSDSLRLGGDYEFFGRPEWDSLRRAYGLRPAETLSMDASFMCQAVVEGRVDAVAAFSTDGRIDAFDLKTLADPKGAIPPYEAVILLSPAIADEAGVADALTPLLGAIDERAMRAANRLVDVDGASIDEAVELLFGRIFQGGSPAVSTP